jgi:4-aminobutyrate aminotransferase-like enzyme
MGDFMLRSPFHGHCSSLVVFFATSLGYGYIAHWKIRSQVAHARKILVQMLLRRPIRIESGNKQSTLHLNNSSYKNTYYLRKTKLSPSLSLSYENSGPLMILRGQGSRLMDQNGGSYLDTRNNVAHVGHCHPKVVAAVQDQVAHLNTNTRYLHPNICLLAERLLRLFPSPLEVVFFVNSGSEANDLALRLARAKTGCKNAIVMDHAYHGHTMGTLDVSPYKFETSREFTFSEGPCNVSHVKKVPFPDMYRVSFQDSASAVKHFASFVKQACNDFGGKGHVSALIMESGMRYVMVGYLFQTVLQRCLFIA